MLIFALGTCAFATCKSCQLVVRREGDDEEKNRRNERTDYIFDKLKKQGELNGVCIPKRQSRTSTSYQGCT